MPTQVPETAMSHFSVFSGRKARKLLFTELGWEFNTQHCTEVINDLLSIIYLLEIMTAARFRS